MILLFPRLTNFRLPMHQNQVLTAAFYQLFVSKGNFFSGLWQENGSAKIAVLAKNLQNTQTTTKSPGTATGEGVAGCLGTHLAQVIPQGFPGARVRSPQITGQAPTPPSRALARSFFLVLLNC